MSHLLPWIRFLSSHLSSILSLYYLSIVMEVLLRLLTYGGDLVSED
jgi:hypothetical protein